MLGCVSVCECDEVKHPKSWGFAGLRIVLRFTPQPTSSGMPHSQQVVDFVDFVDFINLR